MLVTAADIITNDKVEILNPHQHIATLGNSANFNAEIIVSYGRGYVPVENRSEQLPVGYIAIDALHSPIRKVNYENPMLVLVKEQTMMH